MFIFSPVPRKEDPETQFLKTCNNILVKSLSHLIKQKLHLTSYLRFMTSSIVHQNAVTLVSCRNSKISYFALKSKNMLT